VSYNETSVDDFFAIFAALALFAIWLRAANVRASLRVRARLSSLLACFTSGRVSARSLTSFVRADFPSRGQKKQVRDLPTLPGGSRTELFFDIPEIVWDIERAPGGTSAQSQTTNQPIKKESN